MRLIYFLFFTIFIVSSCSKDRNLKKEYHENNTIREEYYVNKNGKIDGILKKYNKNGQLMKLSYYENGKKEGFEIKYSEDGKTKSIGNFKQGMREGKKIFFQSNNEIGKILTYREDTLNGINYTFYKNGLIEGIGYSKDTLINGPQYLYYKNGILHKYSYIKNNRQIFYKKFDSCGKMIKMDGYIMPKIMGYNSKQIPDTLWFNIINPPCSKNGVKIIEFDNNSENITYSENNVNKVRYQIRDTSKNIRIEAFLRDLQTNKKLENHFELRK